MLDTKTSIIIRNDLADWQKLNVTAFLTSGIVGPGGDLIGDRYEDASGQSYKALMIQPMIVLTTDLAGLKKIHGRALTRGVDMAIYIEEMFATGHDEANRAVVKSCETDALNLVGIAMRDDKKLIDKVTKGAKMHP